MQAARRLRIPHAVAELLRHLHPNVRQKIRAAFLTIAADPSSGKELKDELQGYRSFRVGRRRVIYQVSTTAVEIVRVGPRATIYEETYRLLKREPKDPEVQQTRARYARARKRPSRSKTR